MSQVPEQRPSRWIPLHLTFAVVAVVVLLLPAPALGVRVLLLVVGYLVAVPLVALTTGDRSLWLAWAVLAPMSVLMVLPDWFLSAELGVLEFPDTGAPFIGTVPLFMAGMWTIALLPLCLVGAGVERNRGPAAGFATVAAAGLLLFWAAERLAPTFPLWEPVGVAQVAGVAGYVLLPEIGLTVAAYALVRGAGTRSRWANAGGIVAIPFMYLGMLVSSYQFLG